MMMMMMMIVYKMTAHCAGTVQMREESGSGISIVNLTTSQVNTLILPWSGAL